MSDTNVLANAIRAIYIKYRRAHDSLRTGFPSDWGSSKKAMARWDGGTDSRGARHANFWLKAAKIFKAKGLDPESVINSLFDFCDTADAPGPEQIISERAISLSYDYAERKKQELKISMDCERRYALTQYFELQVTTDWDDKKIWKSVILSPGSQISPLMRYILAVETNQPDLAEKYRAAGSAQYSLQKNLYDEIGISLP
jgi:hypothetical protein